TKGAGLADFQIDQLIAMIRNEPFVAGSPSEAIPVAAFEANPLYREGFKEVDEIEALVRAAGYGHERIRRDPSVIRGLEYYTGPVFEAELLFEVKDEDGKPVRFGSVGGGGRYDGLVSRFLNEPVPATGFSIGVSRLLAALQALGKVSTKPLDGPVLVLAMDRDVAAMASYQQMVAALRAEGIRAEIYLGSAGMKAQMKYADRRASPIAIIQGSNEREKGTAQVKDLVLGATLSATKDREEYLALQAKAQFEVPVSGLVQAIRDVLARQRV
ncbi:MAG: ATP phosphoribosyltransferase regulatory subunit, partial [Rhabdaerophilum sp.]